MGTEEFWVPAVVGALSAGAQYANTSQARSRQDTAETQSIIDQQALQQKAVGGVNALTKSIGADTPTKLAAQATGSYVSQLRRNQGASNPDQSSALAPAIGASSRYKAGQAADAATVDSYGNNIAGEMGQIDAATRQRQNEGLAQNRLGVDINGLGAASYTKNFVDQLRASSAGTPNPWVGLGATLLGQGAKGYTANPKVTPSTSNFDGSMNPSGSSLYSSPTPGYS